MAEWLIPAGAVWRTLARLGAALAVAAAASVVATHGAGAASPATIQLSSTSASATQVTYTVGFTSPGALASGTGTITLSAPAGTAFPSASCDYTVANSTSTRSANCLNVVLGSGGRSVTITSNVTIAAGNAVVVTVLAVGNPTASGSDSLSVTTSAGGNFVAPYTLTKASTVAGLTVTASSASAGASEVTDVISFTAPNGLTAGESLIVVVGPAGSVFSSTGCAYTVFDALSERAYDCLPVTITGGSTVAVTPEISTSPGDPLRLTISGVTNPASAGSDSLSLHTTSDPTPATVPFAVSPATAVSNLSLSTTAKDARATGVTDVVTFVPSTSLSGGTSTIDVTAPAGSVLPADGCDYAVYDTSTKRSSSCLSVSVSEAGNGVTITTGVSVASGVKTVLTMNVVSNPAVVETGSLTLSTTSDTTPVSVADDIAASTGVKSFTVSANARAVSASGVTYTATFVSPSGLTSGSSVVTLNAPAGTVLPAASCGTYVMEDLTTSKSNGCLSGTVSGNVATITAGVTVGRGNSVELVANDVTNAGAAGSHSVSLTTSSDPQKVSSSLSLTAPTKVTGFAFSSVDRSAGAVRSKYTLTFTVVGGLNRTFGRITVTVPPGTTLPASGCGSYDVSDDTTGQGNGCLSVTVTGQTASIQPGVTVSPGDTVTVTIAKADNPTKAGSDTVKVSTSSDATVASAAFVVKAEASLKDVTFTASSHAAGATGVSYTITFVVTGGMTADTSTVTITPTTGTTTVTFPTPTGCGEYTDLNTTTGTGWACAGGTPTTTGTGVTFTPDESATTGNTFTITINNVTNPSKVGTSVFKLHSSFDPKPVKLTLTLTTPTAVKKLVFSPSSFSSSATEVTYDETFTVTGGLTERYSTITLTVPAGAVLPGSSGCGPYVIADTTDAQSGNCESVTVLDGGSTAVLAAPVNIRPGDAVNVAVYGVDNPTAAGNGSVSVSTSSDTTGIAAPFAVTAKSKVTGATLKVTGSSPPYKATIGFTSKNGLTSQYSTLTLTAPSGSTLPSNGCDYTVADTTDGQNAGCPSVQSTGATAVMTLPIDVRPEDGVQVAVETVTGTKPTKLTIATSSDPASVST